MKTLLPINREDWLTRCAVIIDEELFRPSGYTVPRKIRYSVSLPSRNAMSKSRTTIGQCWSASVSEDGHNEIFITPLMDDVRQVVATVIHEMVHAVVGLNEGHNKVFKRCALDVGLEGKMTATTLSDTTWKFIEESIARLGVYPHGKMTPVSNKKKQTTRMVKVECLNGCDFHYRQSRKMMETAEAECPICSAAMGVKNADS